MLACVLCIRYAFLMSSGDMGLIGRCAAAAEYGMMRLQTRPSRIDFGTYFLGAAACSNWIHS